MRRLIATAATLFVVAGLPEARSVAQTVVKFGFVNGDFATLGGR